MGPTGAGKSTLCLCMNGLIPLKTRGWIKGEVNVLGKNSRKCKMSDLGLKIGLIFQDPETQFIMMNVEDEIALGLETLGISRGEIKERIEWALDLVGLKGFEAKSPEELSGGQKQRVAIASIMAMRPEILILDEPTSDLDPEGKREIFEVLEKIRTQFDLTIVLITHETKKVKEFCDRVVLIDEGKVKYDGVPMEFLKETALLKSSGIFNPTSYKAETIEPQQQKDNIKEIILEAKEISYTYPNATKALYKASMQIQKNDFIAIIGQNGSGKTTLIKNLNGLLSPQEGTVQLKGRDISMLKVPEIAKIIGYCYQDPDYQLFKNTIQEEMEFSLKILKYPEEIIERRTREAKRLLGLDEFEEIYKSTIYLSKGVRQRLALASVIVLEPEILIIDEPTTGQDYRMIDEFMKILNRLHSEGKTIIIITHDPYIISNYTHHVVIMDNGEVIKRVETRHFLKDGKLQKIASFLPV